MFADLLFGGKDHADEWIFGDDVYDDEVGDQLRCAATWHGPHFVPPRATYAGGPCQVLGRFHGQARRQNGGWFCLQHCKQLQDIRQDLDSAKAQHDFLKELTAGCRR